MYSGSIDQKLKLKIAVHDKMGHFGQSKIGYHNTKPKHSLITQQALKGLLALQQDKGRLINIKDFSELIEVER